MNTILRMFCVAPILLGMAGAADAQVAIYRDCVVSDVAGFSAALTRFYDSMTGVEKPSATLNRNIFNGESPTTHALIEQFPDYAAVEAWQEQAREARGALLQLEASADPVASCETEGLVVEIGSWGDPEARDGDYHIIYPISTTDPAAYAAAMDRLAQALTDEAPGATALFANRSGVADATHFLVQWGPSFTALNEWMDEYPQTDAFQRFTDEVSSIRTVAPVVQRETLARWNQ